MTLTLAELQDLEAKALKARAMCLKLFNQPDIGTRTRLFLNGLFLKLSKAPPNGTLQVDTKGLKTLALLSDCMFRSIELSLAQELYALQENLPHELRLTDSPNNVPPGSTHPLKGPDSNAQDPG